MNSSSYACSDVGFVGILGFLTHKIAGKSSVLCAPTDTVFPGAVCWHNRRQAQARHVLCWVAQAECPLSGPSLLTALC